MRIKRGLAAVFVVCGVIVLPAGMASADQSAIVTIGVLEAEGYTVNVDRVGSAPLSECIVTSVRNPQTVTRLVALDNDRRHGHNGHHDRVWVVVSRSISVSLDCAR